MTIYLLSMYNYYAALFSYHTFHTFINYVETFQIKISIPFTILFHEIYTHTKTFSHKMKVFSKGPKTFIYILMKMKLNKKIPKVLHITW
jgi:hypothetical protein